MAVESFSTTHELLSLVRFSFASQPCVAGKLLNDQHSSTTVFKKLARRSAMLRRPGRLRTFGMLSCAIVSNSAASAGDLESIRSAEPDVATRIERGLDYLYGTTVERDHVNALKWFILADKETYYQLVANHMTAVQISHAVALAEICGESKFADCD